MFDEHIIRLPRLDFLANIVDRAPVTYMRNRFAPLGQMLTGEARMHEHRVLTIRYRPDNLERHPADEFGRALRDIGFT